MVLMVIIVVKNGDNRRIMGESWERTMVNHCAMVVQNGNVSQCALMVDIHFHGGGNDVVPVMVNHDFFTKKLPR